MTIKTVKFSGLSSTNLSYTVFGGIRFYDENNILISSGAIISNGGTNAETDNFLITATNGYNHPYYYIGNAFDSSALQTGDYNDSCYWLTFSDNQTITCEFKTPVSKLGKIEFVPLPDSYTNRGVDEQFNIELWDEFDVLLKTYNIIPITTNNTVQTVVTTVDDITTSMGIITNNSAEMLIDITLSQSTSVSYHIEYTTDSTFATGIQITSEKVVTSSDLYTEVLTGLFKDTVYYYKVVANYNVSGIFVSDIKSFKTVFKSITAVSYIEKIITKVTTVVVINIQIEALSMLGQTITPETEIEEPNNIYPYPPRIHSDINPVEVTGDFVPGIISGIVEKREIPIPGAKVIIVNSVTEKVETIVITDQTGKYSAQVSRYDTFHVIVEYQDDDGYWQAKSIPFVKPEI